MIEIHATWLLNLALLGLVIWALDRARPSSPQPLYLQVQGRWISGVCRGIAHTTGVRVWVVRLGFLVALALDAHAILAYLALGLIVRWDPAQRPLLWSNRLWARVRGATAG